MSALKATTRRVGRVFVVLLTDLIIRVGEKLLCQLLGIIIWIVFIELDNFSRRKGLDTRFYGEIRGKNLRGRKELAVYPPFA